MQQRNMPFTITRTRPGTPELLLRCRRRKSIPVLGIHAIGDDPVAKVSHGSGDVSTGFEIGGTHVGGLDTDDVDECGFELLHFGGELGYAHRVQGLWVCPGVRGDLVASSVCGFDGGSAVVDAAVEGAGEEEGCFGPGGVESLDEFLGVLAWTVVESQSKDAWLAALGVDHTGCWAALS